MGEPDPAGVHESVAGVEYVPGLSIDLAEGRRRFNLIMAEYDKALAAKAKTMDTSVADPWHEWLNDNGYALLMMASAYAAQFGNDGTSGGTDGQ